MLEPAEERVLIGRWLAQREQAALDALIAAHRASASSRSARWRA